MSGFRFTNTSDRLFLNWPHIPGSVLCRQGKRRRVYDKQSLWGQFRSSHACCTYSVTSLQSYRMVFSSVFSCCNDGFEHVVLRTHTQHLCNSHSQNNWKWAKIVADIVCGERITYTGGFPVTRTTVMLFTLAGFNFFTSMLAKILGVKLIQLIFNLPLVLLSYCGCTQFKWGAENLSFTGCCFSILFSSKFLPFSKSVS